jgi:hypothetical protein
MPAHRHRLTHVARAPRLARALALSLVVALLMAGCGGKDEEPKASKKDAATAAELTAAAEPSASESAAEEVAPDPGYGAPQVGRCYRLSATETLAPVTSSRRVSCGKKHTTVIAHIGYLKKPVTSNTPLAKRRAIGKRICAPAYRKLAGGTVPDRATSLLTWTLFTPTSDQLQRGARWVRCDVLARSGESLVALPDSKPLLGKGVPESLRVCQTETGADVSCSRPHAFRVEAVYAASGGAYPDPNRYTAAARARCKELMGKAGGYWQPPSEAGWKAGDRYIRCLARTSS